MSVTLWNNALFCIFSDLVCLRMFTPKFSSKSYDNDNENNI